MSHSDKTPHQGAGLRPTPHYSPGFAPQYEAQVNHNLRNFDRIEEHAGSNNYHQNAPQSNSWMSSKKVLATAIIALLIMLGIVIATPIFVIRANRNHNSNTTVTTTTPPIAEMSSGTTTDDLLTRETITTAAAPTVLTVISHVTTTHIATTTLISTVTETDPILTSIDQAASSFYDAVRSLEASMVSSGQSRLSEALTFSDAATTTVTPVSRDTTTTVTAATSTEAVETATPEPDTASAWMGFCGVPGMFCERDVEDE